MDLGSTCTIITLSESRRLGLLYDSSIKTNLRGYGNELTPSLGTSKVTLEIDDVSALIEAIIVPDGVQKVPVLVGHTFTELPEVLVVKDDSTLTFKLNPKKVSRPDQRSSIREVLRVVDDTLIPPNYLGNVKVKTDSDYKGDLLVDARGQRLYG